MKTFFKLLLNFVTTFSLLCSPLHAMYSEQGTSSTTSTVRAVASPQSNVGDASATTSVPSASSSRELVLFSPPITNTFTSTTAGASSSPSSADASDTSSSSEEEAQPAPLNFKLGKFKLGYEFQEISGLCPWALEDYRTQKKPLFSLRIKGSKQKLWDVVLDTSDIEFVTVPFANHERELLEECVTTVLLSLNALQTLFESRSEVSFPEWASELEGLLLGSPYGVFYSAAYCPLVDRDGRNLICPSSPWRPKFSPQATIQHRLECTIPLYFSLFGFTSREMPFFSDAFPLRDRFLKTLKTADSLEFEEFLSGEEQKINGLVFLHALTLVRMAAEEGEPDRDHLQETYQFLTSTHQVDPKAKLVLMSRRPFSSMLRDIGMTDREYAKYFYNVMLREDAEGPVNSGFSKIPFAFSKTNYAEQFFDPETGQERDLSESFLPLFQAPFKEGNFPMLNYLLKRGVVSTAMLRNFREDITVRDQDGLPMRNAPSISRLFEGIQFFRLALTSVQQPESTFVLHLNPPQIRFASSTCDVLSPPCFLDGSNSMGRLKDDLTSEEREFGEAIVEIRGVKDVQPWFFRQCKLNPDLRGEFLQIPFLDESWKQVYSERVDLAAYRNVTSSFRQQALGLFDFLDHFGTKPRQVREICYMGIPTGLKWDTP